MERTPQRVVHKGRIGHDGSKHHMLRDVRRPPRRCRKRSILLHQVPLAVAPEEFDDGAHAIAAMPMTFDGGSPKLRTDTVADGAVLAYLGRLTSTSRSARHSPSAGGAGAVDECLPSTATLGVRLMF